MTPLVLSIFGKPFGALGFGIMRVIGTFIQICGFVGGGFALYAAGRAYFTGTRD